MLLDVLLQSLIKACLTRACLDCQAGPAAHAGFLSRTAEVPVESLFAHACRTKKQLIFIGLHLCEPSLSSDIYNHFTVNPAMFPHIMPLISDIHGMNSHRQPLSS